MTDAAGVQPSGRLKLKRLWVALGLAIMAWTLWMALRPDPGIVLAVPDGDKLLHAITFTCLMGWWGNVYPSRRARVIAAAACLGFGIFIELAQWLDPPRDADVFDVVADAVGIFCAWLLLRTRLANVLPTIERWF